MNANVPLFFLSFFCLRSTRECIRTRIQHVHLRFVLANKSFSLRGRSSRVFFFRSRAGIEAERLDKFYLHECRLLPILDRRRNFLFFASFRFFLADFNPVYEQFAWITDCVAL